MRSTTSHRLPGRRRYVRCRLGVFGTPITRRRSRRCEASSRDRISQTEAEFRSFARQGYNRVPLVLESFADLDTPLSLYVKLANERYTFLLESVVGGKDRPLFIHRPSGAVRIRARGSDIEVDEGGAIVERHRGDPLAFVSEFMRRYRAAPRPGLPRFCGGLAGYFGYDTVRHIETKLAGRAPPASPDLADVPDLMLLLTEELAVVDNLAGKIYLIVYADPGDADGYARARDRLQALRRAVREPVSIPFQTATEVTEARSEFGADGFENAVRRAKEYIVAGDVMQVVLSQRMRRPFASSPLSLYRALRSLNPSPYMFITTSGFPCGRRFAEILVRKEGSAVTLRPIAAPVRAVRPATLTRISRRKCWPTQGDRRARDACRSRRNESDGSRRRAPSSSPSGW